MPRSPKRYGFVMDDVEQSFVETTSSRPPRLTMSPSSSNESIDRLMPSTPRSKPSTPLGTKNMSTAAPPPSATTESILLPGFHFSTTDESVDPAEFHRVAAQLLSGEAPRRDSAVAEEVSEDAQPRQLHCDLGKDPSGRYCCSCGKSYSNQFRLREHTQACAGTTDHPCLTCDKIFSTKEKLNRHVASRHNDNKEACPECGELFPANYLPKHLASGLGGCDGMVQASLGPAPEIDRAYRLSAGASTSQHYWIYDGDLRWRPFRDAKHDPKIDGEYEVADQTRDIVSRLLRRPRSQEAMESCDLCDETFHTEDELMQHIGEHSLDFNEKRHRCDECMIYFANEKDLERHLQSVNLSHHCGFTFRHCAGLCTGHHPPTYFKSSLCNDHNLMQKHLWSWELSQLRTHRATVARLLAQRLNQSASPHMSVQNCRRTYYSLLPHISIANRDSARPESGWMKDRRESETTELDAHFSRILSQTFPEEDLATIKKIQEADAALDIRPDSTVLADQPRESTSKLLSTRKSITNLAKRKTVLDGVKHGHRRGHSNPMSFLRRTASSEDARPTSLPARAVGSTPLVKLSA